VFLRETFTTTIAVRRKTRRLDMKSKRASWNSWQRVQWHDGKERHPGHPAGLQIIFTEKVISCLHQLTELHIHPNTWRGPPTSLL